MRLWRIAVAIGGISSLSSSGSTLRTGSASARTQPRRSGASRDGSAFVLGGNSPNFAQGLYDSLGGLIGANRSAAAGQAAAKTAPPSRAQQQRTAALKEAAFRIDQGDARGGRAVAEKLLKANASDITAIRLVAVSYLSEGNYKKAEAFYSRAASLAPESKTLRDDVAIARTLQKSDREVLTEGRRQIGNPTQRRAGLRLLRLLSERTPQDPKVFVALAEGLSAARKPSGVLGALQEALRVADPAALDEVIAKARKLADDNPRAGVSRNLLGRALRKAGRFNEALAELKSASDLAPQNQAYSGDLAGAYAARADDKLTRGDVTAAKVDLSAARTIDAGNSAVRETNGRISFELAKQDMRAGRYKRVLGRLLTASAQGPKDVAFRKEVATQFVRAGSYYQGQGDDSLAISAYAQAYELDPSSTLARDGLAKASYAQGVEALNAKNYDAAITDLQRAYDTRRITADYGKDLARALDGRGQFNDANGDLTKAIADFKKANSIDPTNTSISTNLSNALRKQLGI